MTSTQNALGSVVSLWRYPVKSMLGEELNAAAVTQRGLSGDRLYGIVDSSDGKVATAKNPRKWPHLFDFRSSLDERQQAGTQKPPARITLPDGSIVHSDQANVDQILSQVLNRQVTLRSVRQSYEETTELASPNLQNATAEEYWPDTAGLDYRDTVTDFSLPEGTFFDSAFAHLLTTATLDQLRALAPQGRFEVRRFRPNIVIETTDGEKGFVENAWVGQVLAIGDTVRLSITGPCPRCVMTTLAQGDLPKDSGILRTAAQHNRANVGVYAAVLQGGKIRRGDSVRLEQS